MTKYSKFKQLLLFPAILIMFSITAFAAPKAPASKATAPTGTTTVQDPNNPLNPIYLDSKGGTAGTGDISKSGIASPDAKAGAGWHPAALASTNLPMDKYGLIDWAKVVRANNLIAPRFSIDPAAKADEETILDMTILFETKSTFMDNVPFPHYMHTWWLKCEACHQTVGGPIFEMGAGANKVTMVEMSNGIWCGRCHGKVAFPLADCRRCHNWPKAKKPDDTVTVRPK